MARHVVRSSLGTILHPGNHGRKEPNSTTLWHLCPLTQRDIILAPPTDSPHHPTPYTILKGSNQHKHHRLLNELELGDRKPSQFIRCMHQLRCGEEAVSDDALWELFLQRLPSNVRMVLAPSGTGITLDNLGQRWRTVSWRCPHPLWPQCTLPLPPPRSVRRDRLYVPRYVSSRGW